MSCRYNYSFGFSKSILIKQMKLLEYKIQGDVLNVLNTNNAYFNRIAVTPNDINKS